tara:strand:- start:285 stop:404 length:120 start_codon:yes stop_codon:yes gene_type:complete
LRPKSAFIAHSSVLTSTKSEDSSSDFEAVLSGALLVATK